MSITFGLILTFVGLFIFKYQYEGSKSHQIYKILGKLNEIRVLDNTGLIAIINSDRSIEWFREVSLYKMSKIKLISDRYEEEVELLKKEMSCH